MNWFLRQAKQPSTWKGIFLLIGLFGYSLEPALQNEIIAAVIAIVGIIEIIQNDDRPATRVDIQLPPIEMVSQYNRDQQSFGSVADRRVADSDRLRESMPTGRGNQSGFNG